MTTVEQAIHEESPPRSCIYLDAAATSYPKQQNVIDAVVEYLQLGTSPGRSGHALARWSEERVWEARVELARLFGTDAPERVTFSQNATLSLNAVANHLANGGGEILTSAFEHNSVMRPLHAYAERGRLTHTAIPPTATEPLDLEWLEHRLRHHPPAGVVMTWASNVTGNVLPVEQVSFLCRQYGVFLAVDAAQAAGYVPVDADIADVIVFAGHKGLGGPQGVGGCVIREGTRLESFVRGGSGGKSESPTQPRWLPWAQEAGTLNGPNIAGLGAAVRELTNDEVQRRHDRSTTLRQRLVEVLDPVPGVEVVANPSSLSYVGVLSLRIASMHSTTVASILEEEYGILVRAGLHCAPMAHATLGTQSTGTVRISLGSQTTEDDVDAAASSIAKIATNRL